MIVIQWHILIYQSPLQAPRSLSLRTSQTLTLRVVDLQGEWAALEFPD
jgi:hypothetical protein